MCAVWTLVITSRRWLDRSPGGAGYAGSVPAGRRFSSVSGSIARPLIFLIRVIALQHDLGSNAPG